MRPSSGSAVVRVPARGRPCILVADWRSEALQQVGLKILRVVGFNHHFSPLNSLLATFYMILFKSKLNWRMEGLEPLPAVRFRASEGPSLRYLRGWGLGGGMP